VELEKRLAQTREDLKPIASIEESMAWWACFRPDPEKAKIEPLKEVAQAEPVQAGNKVGRNDPCPCGSRKKFKKCCGKTE
jgi:preprotein translocase subunit SecA